MKCCYAKLPIAFVLVLGFAGSGPAAAVNVTGTVTKECQWDYHNYCSEYGIGSALLSLCFKQNGAKLSQGCIAALEQAGDVSQSYVQAREKAGH